MADRPRHIPPVPLYTLIDTSRGRDPAIVVVNTALRAYPHRELFAWHLYIQITCELMGDNGMPTAQEVEALGLIEDEISDRVLTDDNAVFVARVTCRGVRELNFRVRDPRVADACLNNLVSAVAPTCQWEYRIERDPEWALAEPELALLERSPETN